MTRLIKNTQTYIVLRSLFLSISRILLAFKKRLNSLLLLALLFSLFACNNEPPSPEDALREVISDMELAAEDRSLSDFMQHVSESYSDHKGNDRKAIANYVRFNFIRNQSINIFSQIKSLEIIENNASVEISVAMGSKTDNLNSETTRLRAKTLQFSVLFQLNDNKWMVKSVSWQDGW